MRSNQLQLNASKTEILWCVSSRRQHQIPQTPFRVCSDSIQPASSIHNPGIYLASVQLFSVHAFIRRNGELKQLTLAFGVMSRRRRSDRYERIVHSIVDALPSRPVVQVIVADFERAVWAAVQTVLPGVTQCGAISTSPKLCGVTSRQSVCRPRWRPTMNGTGAKMSRA